MNDFLNRVFWGNDVKTWLIALAIAAGGVILLAIIRKVVIVQFDRIAQRTENKIDDLIAAILRVTKGWFLSVVGVFVGLKYVTLPPAWDDRVNKAFLVVLFLQVGYWGSSAIRFWINDLIERRSEEDKASATTLSVLGFLARLIFWAAMVLLALDNLGFDITAMVAGLGIGGVAVALAVQGIFADLFASLVIILDKPFVIGDFIIVGDMMGSVERIGLKTTRVRSLGGEQLVFSHSDLLKSRIRNYKKMQERRILFSVGVTYQTPKEKLEEIPAMIKEVIEGQEGVRFDRSHFARMENSSLAFENVYYVLSPDYNVYMNIQQAINLAIYERFQAEGIEFAYPTQTLFLEGLQKGAAS